MCLFQIRARRAGYRCGRRRPWTMTTPMKLSSSRVWRHLFPSLSATCLLAVVACSSNATLSPTDGGTGAGATCEGAPLLGKADLFRNCFAEKLLTFSLGRGLEYYDKCAVDEIVKAAKTDCDRFSALVLAVVKSDPFQKRKGKRSE